MSTQMIMTMPPSHPMASPIATKRNEETIGTRVWIDEYAFLQSLYASADNYSPKFRMPDLISACVSLVFVEPDPAKRIFTYLHTELVLRDPECARRQEEMWKPQYNLLLALQRSPANGHPHPQFKLDHFTTACISLARTADDAKRRIFEQARRNTAERANKRSTDTQLNQ